jgi:hypothetical protein
MYQLNTLHKLDAPFVILCLSHMHAGKQHHQVVGYIPVLIISAALISCQAHRS